MTSAIDVRHLCKTYGSVVAVEDLSFQIAPGTFVGFLGPNGAGKTTLLQALLGFHPPTSGTARVLGLDVRTQIRDIRHRIGYMPENDSYIASMSAIRFVRMMAELSGLPPEAAMERAHETLFYVGLGIPLPAGILDGIL